MIENVSEVSSTATVIPGAISELELDNIGGQRSKFDAIAAILYISLDGSLKNHIIGKGNFSDAMVNHYLTILLYHNLLETHKDESNNNRTYYKTTQKGRLMIQHYNIIQRLFAREDNSSTKSTGHGRMSSSNGRDRDIDRHVILSTKKILIIDDESDITSALKDGLENYGQGYEVDVYNDPILALSKYKNGIFDLIILDVRMPKMDGFEVYTVIRKLDGEVKICFWTAFDLAYEELRKAFPSKDELYFIKKPITMDDLIDRIRKITSLR